MPRNEIVRFLPNAYDAFPECIKQFAVGPDGLLAMLDSYVDQILIASAAIQVGRIPVVSLKALASFLQAEVLFYASGLKDLEGNILRARGTLRYLQGQKWVITVSGSGPAARVAVSHELAHILFYRFRKSRTGQLWRDRRWTLFEEVFANYVARRILIPPSTYLPPLSTDNFALYLVQSWQKSFLVPQEVAALRWLDEQSCLADRTHCILIARQYQPFNTRFINRVAAHSRELRVFFNGIVNRVVHKCRTHASQLAFWRSLFDHESEAPSDGVHFEELEIFRQQLTLKLNDLSTPEEQSELRKAFCGFDPHFSFHYVWFCWRTRPELPCYFWLRRGKIGRNSQAAKLARGFGAPTKIRNSNDVSPDPKGKTAELMELEQLDIHSLKGQFLMHGYAHGNVDEGKRFIIQVANSL